MGSITLSVIIVNYNTRADLHACLSAIHECHPLPEVIVVDNASTDGSAAMVRESFPRVVLLEPGRNTWFCGGNNLGLAAAHGEYALLLNPDTIPPPGAFARMVDFLRAHPAYAGVTLQLRYPDGTIQRTCSRIPTFEYLLITQTPLQWLFPRRRRALQAHHWYDDQGWDRTVDHDVEAVPGSCTLMRHADLHLNPDLRLYFPEEALARTAGGRKFRFLAEPFIWHREKSATRSARAMRIYFADMITYTRRYHGAAHAALLWACSRPLQWALEIGWLLRTWRSRK
ncbi:MAG: glycosyltransferase family 2 protein [bacterium]|nr:glycosyltransferase family 2 protein [bacterium]